MAPPTCTVELTMPDASPESSIATPDIASGISDGKARPAPTPMNTVAGEHVGQEGAVDRRAGEQQQADADRHDAGDEHAAARRSA